MEWDAAHACGAAPPGEDDALDFGLPLVLPALRPQAAGALQALSAARDPAGRRDAAQSRPRGEVFRRHAGRRDWTNTNARSLAAQPQVRVALRGHLQFPEQDVPGRNAPGCLRDDRALLIAPASRSSRPDRMSRTPRSLSAGRRGCRPDRRRAVLAARAPAAARLASPMPLAPSSPRDCTASPPCAPGEAVRRERRDGFCPSAHYEGFAAWDLVDMERYRSMWLNAHGYFSLNMAASRGCSFRCAWCAKPIWGNHYLQRSAQRRRGGDGLSEAHLRARPHLVCR